MQLDIDLSKTSNDYYIEIDESSIQSEIDEDNNPYNQENEFQTNIQGTSFLPKFFNLNRTKSIYLDEISESLKEIDEFSNINNNRIELLVRKYCNNKFEVEESARLKLLSKKLKKYFPMVEDIEYETLDKILTETNKIKLRNKKRKKKYNIK